MATVEQQTQDALTNRDIGILQKYDAEGKRELYWGYLVAKGDKYAELALGVVHNNTFSGQIANMSLMSHVPDSRKAEFTEEKIDGYGIDLMHRDFEVRKRYFDNPDKHLDTGRGLHLGVEPIQTYHRQWLIEKVHLSPEAWTMERVVAPYLDKGDVATANQLWQKSMSEGLEFVVGGTEMVARSLDLDTVAQNYAVAQGSQGAIAESHINAWSIDTTVSTLQYNPDNNFNNPNHIRGWDYDEKAHEWYKDAHGRRVLDPNSNEALALNQDREWRVARLQNADRFEPHFLDQNNPQATIPNITNQKIGSLEQEVNARLIVDQQKSDKFIEKQAIRLEGGSIGQYIPLDRSGKVIPKNERNPEQNGAVIRNIPNVQVEPESRKPNPARADYDDGHTATKAHQPKNIRTHDGVYYPPKNKDDVDLKDLNGTPQQKMQEYLKLNKGKGIIAEGDVSELNINGAVVAPLAAVALAESVDPRFTANFDKILTEMRDDPDVMAHLNAKGLSDPDSMNSIASHAAKQGFANGAHPVDGVVMMDDGQMTVVYQNPGKIYQDDYTINMAQAATIDPKVSEQTAELALDNHTQEFAAMVAQYQIPGGMSHGMSLGSPGGDAGGGDGSGGGGAG